uniref:F-box domain-containing protein n=1 Tax=Leersia perrieri TaxID=77586 RepID=A0A0D9WDD8_9ORYZ
MEEGTATNKRPRRMPAPPSREDVVGDQEEEEKLIGNDDLLVEILSCVPYKSLIRSKCVSRRWRRVISDPDHRRRLPRYELQPMDGFFYTEYHIESQSTAHRFTTVTSAERPPFVDPSFSFLPKCERLNLLDSCNGLLLLRCWTLKERKKFFKTFNYVLVQELVDYEEGDTELDFDGDGHVPGLKIYSSETEVWTDEMKSEWGINISIQENNSKGVYFNGMLHLPAKESVVAVVDLEGKNWRTIPLPHKDGSPLFGAHPPYASHTEGFIDLSQGLLHFVSTDKYDKNKISLWVLDN